MFISLFILISVKSGFLFLKTNYPRRIDTNIRIGGIHSEENHIRIETWSGALDDLGTDVIFLNDSITYVGD